MRLQLQVIVQAAAISCGLFLASFSTVCGQSDGSSRLRLAGQVRQGVQLKAEILESVVAPGEAVILRLTSHNTTDRPLRLPATTAWQYRLYVEDDEGKKLERRTETYGHKLGPDISLLPHSSYLVSYRLDGDYDLSKEGAYHIAAVVGVDKLDGSGLDDVVSNTVTAQVTNDRALLSQRPIPPLIQGDWKSELAFAGQISQGFILMAEPSRTIITPSEPIVLSVMPWNVTSTYRVFPGFDHSSYRVLVRNAEDRLVPMRPGAAAAIDTGEHNRSLCPNLRYNGQYPLSTYYDLSKEGQYKVNVVARVYRLDGKGTADVVSNTFDLLVTSHPERYPRRPPITIIRPWQKPSGKT